MLNLVDLNSLEISKDSFIEKKLAEYYSDMLYRVMLKDGSQGFITLMEKETGLQWLEVVIRYLASARDEEDLSWEQIKEIAEQAISKETGEYVMSLLEKTKNEGRLEGEQKGKLEGEAKGLKEGIELGITLKFPGDIEAVMAKVNKIDDPEILKEITKTIYTANDVSEILALLK